MTTVAGWRTVAFAVLAVAGCNFDAAGMGSSAGLGDETSDGTSGGMTNTSQASESTTGGGSGMTNTTANPSASTTTDGGGGTTESSAGSTGPGDTALVISDAPMFDFGARDLGSATPHTFMVTNTGDAEATGINAVALPAPFRFAGGSYPGNGGDCTDALSSGSSCSLVVEYAPDAFGPSTSDLSLDYTTPVGAGTTAVSLAGTGVGVTENLIVNPGAEQGGSPPMGWTEIAGTVWTVWSDFTHTGQYCILGGPVGGQSGTYRLGQFFDLTEYADLIDNHGGLHITYNGYARTWGTGDDIYRIGVRTRDSDGTVVDTTITPAGTGTGWAFLELELDTSPTARQIEIQVICVFNAGSACDAFFDDMSLTVSYDGP
jgi:hypothetical protein